MTLATFFTQSADWPDVDSRDGFASRWDEKRLRKGAHLVQQGQPDNNEYIVLNGQLISTICDPDGKEICVGLYAGPCVVTPQIARTRGGVSIVSITATSDVTRARMDSALLSELMISSEPVRHWANGVLQSALSDKADREWCLAALGGAERLKWFRDAYPGYEELFTHVMIASFLGITPVTMSRLRRSTKPAADRG